MIGFVVRFFLGLALALTIVGCNGSKDDDISSKIGGRFSLEGEISSISGGDLSFVWDETASNEVEGSYGVMNGDITFMGDSSPFEGAIIDKDQIAIPIPGGCIKLLEYIENDAPKVIRFVAQLVSLNPTAQGLLFMAMPVGDGVVKVSHCMVIMPGGSALGSGIADMEIIKE